VIPRKTGTAAITEIVKAMKNELIKEGSFVLVGSSFGVGLLL